MSQSEPAIDEVIPGGDMTRLESEALQSAAFDAILEQLNNSAQDTRNTSDQREAFAELASAIGLLRDWAAGEGSDEDGGFEGDGNGRIALYIAEVTEVAEAEEEAERATRATRANRAGTALGTEQGEPNPLSEAPGRPPLSQAGDIVLEVLCDWTIARHQSERADEELITLALTTGEREDLEQLRNRLESLEVQDPAEVERRVSPFGFHFSTSRGFLPLRPDRSDTSDSDARSIPINAQPPYSSFSSNDGFQSRNPSQSGDTLFGVRLSFEIQRQSSLESDWDGDPNGGADASGQSSRPASSESSPRMHRDWPSSGDSSLRGDRRLVHRRVVRRGSPIFTAPGRQAVSAFHPHLDILDVNVTSSADSDSMGENSRTMGERTPRPHSRPRPRTPPRSHPSGTSDSDFYPNSMSGSGSSAQHSNQPSPRAVHRFELDNILVPGGGIRTESPETYLSNSDVLHRAQLRAARYRASTALDTRRRAAVLASHTASSGGDAAQRTALDDSQDEVGSPASVAQLSRAAELIRRIVLRGASGDTEESRPESR